MVPFAQHACCICLRLPLNVIEIKGIREFDEESWGLHADQASRQEGGISGQGKGEQGQKCEQEQVPAWQLCQIRALSAAAACGSSGLLCRCFTTEIGGLAPTRTIMAAATLPAKRGTFPLPLDNAAKHQSCAGYSTHMRACPGSL